MDGFKKAQKNLENDMLVLFIIELIICGLSIYVDVLDIFSIVLAFFLFIGFILSKHGSKSAGIIGITVGIFMMLTIIIGDIIDFLLGLFVVMHSIKYNKLVH